MHCLLFASLSFINRSKVNLQVKGKNSLAVSLDLRQTRSILPVIMADVAPGNVESSGHCWHNGSCKWHSTRSTVLLHVAQW